MLRLLPPVIVAVAVGLIVRHFTHSDVLSIVFSFLVSFFLTKWILERNW